MFELGFLAPVDFGSLRLDISKDSQFGGSGVVDRELTPSAMICALFARLESLCGEAGLAIAWGRDELGMLVNITEI